MEEASTAHSRTRRAGMSSGQRGSGGGGAGTPRTLLEELAVLSEVQGQHEALRSSSSSWGSTAESVEHLPQAQHSTTGGNQEPRGVLTPTALLDTGRCSQPHLQEEAVGG